MSLKSWSDLQVVLHCNHAYVTRKYLDLRKQRSSIWHIDEDHMDNGTVGALVSRRGWAI